MFWVFSWSGKLKGFSLSYSCLWSFPSVKKLAIFAYITQENKGSRRKEEATRTFIIYHTSSMIIYFAMVSRSQKNRSMQTTVCYEYAWIHCVPQYRSSLIIQGYVCDPYILRFWTPMEELFDTHGHVAAFRRYTGDGGSPVFGQGKSGLHPRLSAQTGKNYPRYYHQDPNGTYIRGRCGSSYVASCTHSFIFDFPRCNSLRRERTNCLGERTPSSVYDRHGQLVELY